MEIPGLLIEFFGACGLAAMLAYVIQTAGERPKPTDFLQLLLALVYIYQPLKNLTRLQNQMLTELHPDQVNIVQLEGPGAHKTMLFTKGSAPALIDG